jgi:DNA polymerase
VALDADTRAALLAELAFHVEMGADEAIGDAPVDRFAEADAAPKPAEPSQAPRAPRRAAPAVPAALPTPTAPGEAAATIAAACRDLPALAEALAAFDGGSLKAGAQRCVFADGRPGAPVMIVGEAPGREEDMAGKPFVGRSGQLLDRILASIGLSRTAEDLSRAVYITNVLPWRPVGNRTPAADEVAMLLPFLRRHIDLASPRILVLMGASAATALLGEGPGITRRRGQWGTLAGFGPAPLPVLPTLHPAYLLRNPAAKRLVWRDMLSLRDALDGD